MDSAGIVLVGFCYTKVTLMPNQQLVDYVSQQKKAGIAPEVIKKALLETGWEQRDVDEAMNPVVVASPAVASQSPSQPQPKIEVKPIASAAASSVNVSTFDVKSGPVFEPKSQSQAVSPVASSPVAASSSFRSSQGATAATLASISTQSIASPSGVALAPHKKHILLPMVMGIMILGLGILGYMLWSESSELQGSVTSLAADKAALIAQVDVVKKQIDETERRSVALTEESKDLERQLSLFVGAPNATSTVVTVKGVLNGSDKISYSLITSKGMVLSIKNYKEPLALSVLTPLIGQTIEISGLHALGARDITVTSVNGAVTTPATPSVPPSASTSSTSTPPATP